MNNITGHSMVLSGQLNAACKFHYENLLQDGILSRLSGQIKCTFIGLQRKHMYAFWAFITTYQYGTFRIQSQIMLYTYQTSKLTMYQ